MIHSSDQGISLPAGSWARNEASTRARLRDSRRDQPTVESGFEDTLSQSANAERSRAAQRGDRVAAFADFLNGRASSANARAEDGDVAGEETPGIETPSVPLYEPENGVMHSRFYASADMTRWLADRFGGSVSSYQYRWMTGTSVTPGIQDIVQPPPFCTIDFGETQVNAGELAMYYEPGRFANPDAEAAAALYRSGVGLDSAFVAEHLPSYLRNLTGGVFVNPLTGEEVNHA